MNPKVDYQHLSLSRSLFRISQFVPGGGLSQVYVFYPTGFAGFSFELAVNPSFLSEFSI